MKGNPAFSPPDWVILSILSPQVEGGKRDAISHDAGRGKSGLQIRARGLGRASSHQQPLSVPACENGGGRGGESEEGIQVKAATGSALQSPLSWDWRIQGRLMFLSTTLKRAERGAWLFRLVRTLSPFTGKGRPLGVNDIHLQEKN